MAHSPEDDAIRRRAYEIWLDEGRPEGNRDEQWYRVRDEVQRRFDRDTAHAGEIPDRLKYTQAIEEALEDPGRSRRPGGDQWGTTADQRGAP